MGLHPSSFIRKPEGRAQPKTSNIALKVVFETMTFHTVHFLANATCGPCEHRENSLGEAGWMAIMGSLHMCSNLASLSGVACRGLVAGGLTDLQLGDKEPGLAMGFVQFLGRSGATLASLDMRSRLVLTQFVAEEVARAVGCRESPCTCRRLS